MLGRKLRVFLFIPQWLWRHFRAIGVRFSKVPISFRTRRAAAKFRTVWLQRCFFSRILNMNRDSLHTRNFSCMHFSVSRNRWTKNRFADVKGFWDFRETGPGPVPKQLLQYLLRTQANWKRNKILPRLSIRYTVHWLGLIYLSITEEQTNRTQLITMASQCHPSLFLKANLAPRILYKPLDLTGR